VRLEIYEFAALELKFIKFFLDISAPFGKRARKILLCAIQRSLLAKVFGKIRSVKKACGETHQHDHSSHRLEWQNKIFSQPEYSEGGVWKVD
jgi:hypothetical protein